ncbi:MAG: DUF2065 domain-containing protein [Xanthobacteraceae bacterium]|nr:MAG: DUF2065 domain-containing protein [Xanthobacteraceae bacterium]
MADFLVGIGVLFVIEGLIFAGFPNWARVGMVRAINTPTTWLRTIGVLSAVGGLILIWLIRH